MAWIKEYPISKSKTELIGLAFCATGQEPTYLGKGLSELKLKCVTMGEFLNKSFIVVLTRRDIEVIRANYPKYFEFVVDPNNAEWANVKVLEGQ